MNNLKNKVVVITGASEGLGKAISLRLAKEQVKLLLLARSKDKLLKVKEEASKNTDCEYFVCDVTDFKQVGETVKKIVRKFKKIDILINNAGIWFEGPTTSHSDEKIKELFLTNSLGPILMVKEILPYMQKAKGGQILNIVSSAGVRPDSGSGVYTSTKYALRGFTDSLKMELEGTGIKVMGLYPGGMDTKLFSRAGFGKEDQPWMMRKEDVADVVAFMLGRPDDLTMHHVELRKQNR